MLVTDVFGKRNTISGNVNIPKSNKEQHRAAAVI